MSFAEKSAVDKLQPADRLLSDPSVPLYSQLRDVLRTRILDGHYPAHSQMPSESELGALFLVSRITVRQALAELQREGLIFRIHGKGTFVAKPKAFQNITRLQGFAEAMAGQGHEIINQVTGFKRLPATATVAQRLGLAEGDPVIEIRRIRLLNREPVSLELTWLPPALGEPLHKADLASRDIFLILENDLGVTLGHADISIEAMLADAGLAHALRLEEGSPVLRIERLTHDGQGRPIDFEYLHFRGDAFQYRLQIDRQKSAGDSRT